MRLTLTILVLVAVAVLPPLKQHFEYVLGSTCNGAEVQIAKGPSFRCTGLDKEHLNCTGTVVTVHGKLDDCLSINVVKDK